MSSSSEEVEEDPNARASGPAGGVESERAPLAAHAAAGAAALPVCALAAAEDVQAAIERSPTALLNVIESPKRERAAHPTKYMLQEPEPELEPDRDTCHQPLPPPGPPQQPHLQSSGPARDSAEQLQKTAGSPSQPEPVLTRPAGLLEVEADTTQALVRDNKKGRFLTVTVPQGAKPGQAIVVKNAAGVKPSNHKSECRCDRCTGVLHVVIPPGAPAGSEFQVQLPKQTDMEQLALVPGSRLRSPTEIPAELLGAAADTVHALVREATKHVPHNEKYRASPHHGAAMWSQQRDDIAMHYFDPVATGSSGVLCCATRGPQRPTDGQEAPHEETSFYDGWIWAAAVLVLPSVLGILPFLTPLEGEEQTCTIPGRTEVVTVVSAEGEADADPILQEIEIPCATISTYSFIYWTCPLWLLLCAAMLLELYSIQLSSVGFGKAWHYAFIILGAEGTFIALEQLFSTVFTPHGLVAVLALHMGALILSTWAYLTLAVVLVRGHVQQSHQIEQKRTDEQAVSANGTSGKAVDFDGVESKDETGSQPEVEAEAAAGTTRRLDSRDGLTGAGIAKTRVLANRWKHDSRFSRKARVATVKGFCWWCVGLGLLILNWVWLQVFVLGYMKEATTPTRISIGVLIFNASEAIFGKAVLFAMKSAEIQRKASPMIVASHLSSTVETQFVIALATVRDPQTRSRLTGR